MTNSVAQLPKLSDIRVGIIGLGYVGLPLAVAFARHFPTTGFDIDVRRVEDLRSGRDATLEVEEAALKASRLRLSSDAKSLTDCNFIIVTVPTPIDDVKRPDLRPLFSASKSVGEHIKRGTIVVFESTVYPGATEEECAPIIEKVSGLKFNHDFFAGYSPERINPGDKERTVEKIVKVTSGSTPEAADLIDQVYAKVITAGTFKAQSIRVAEAAKVIENTQRDVNIALVNELATLFGRLNIDTLSVLEAAGTKWNFLPFRPGLVGGHCIGVDPYYLTHKAQQCGHHPEVILAGRRINDNMGQYIATRLVKQMMQMDGDVRGRKVLLLGLTFKENCPDIRNTKVVDIVSELTDYGIKVDVHDPWADRALAKHEYGIDLTEKPAESVYDAVIISVAHRQFKEMGVEAIRKLMHGNGLLFDVKGMFPAHSADIRL
jgi:UDP-N-acetyl-D-glucosamine/UDP-N-acetyl-D-galactosamine dehydrogenase